MPLGDRWRDADASEALKLQQPATENVKEDAVRLAAALSEILGSLRAGGECCFKRSDYVEIIFFSIPTPAAMAR
jgi:hypothetical protein